MDPRSGELGGERRQERREEKERSREPDAELPTTKYAFKYNWGCRVSETPEESQV